MPIVLILLCLKAFLLWKKYQSFLTRNKHNYREGKMRTTRRMKALIQEYLFDPQMSPSMDLSHLESQDSMTAMLEGGQEEPTFKPGSLPAITIGKQEFVSIYIHVYI